MMDLLKNNFFCSFWNGRGGGLFLGAVAACSYGMNPLFGLPLFQDGFTPDAVLFVRYTPALFLLGIWLCLYGNGLALPRRQFLMVIPLGLLFAASSLCLYFSYREMDAGIASTLLFVYPIMTALLMLIFFREKAHLSTWISMILALAGIALLYKKADGSVLSTAGIVLVMVSSLTYALYLILINKSSLKDADPFKVTFYTVLICVIVCSVGLFSGNGHMGRFTLKALFNIVMIALIPTLLSLSSTAAAVQRVGATVTAILGALEPLTAVFFGVLIFHEDFSVRIACGILLILSGVLLIILGKGKKAEQGK